MGLLDDLKKEAEAVKQKQLEETHNKIQALNQNFVLVQGKLTQVYRFLHELINQLNVVKLEVPRSYYIGGFGQVDDMRQADYAVATKNMTIDNRDFIKEIHLRFKCVTDKELKITKESEATVEQFRDYLWRNNLKFDCHESRNPRGYLEKGEFTLASSILVSFLVNADFDQAKIKIAARNFEMLGVNEFTYEVDEITEALLDEFGKSLIGKPNRFRTLGRAQEAMLKARSEKKPDSHPYIVHEDASPAGEEAVQGKKLFGAIKSLFNKDK
jgi:hypothetical protein